MWENRQFPFLAYNFVEGVFDCFCLRLMLFSKQRFVSTNLFRCRFQEMANATIDLHVLNYNFQCSEGDFMENPHDL